MVMALLLLPPLNMLYPVIHEKPLDGDFVIPSRPGFNTAGWIEGIFQENFESWADFNIGFHNTLFRLANQVDYSLFGKTRNDDIIRGKDNYFFEYDYIRAHSGIDYIGEKYLDRFIRRLKFLQNKLKRDHNTDLIFVFEPGKASFLPEMIPDEYQFADSTMTNYKKMVELCEEHDLTFLDLNRFFLSLKGTTPYPLFNRYGTHWTLYGMSLAVDSLIRFIEDVRDIDLPDYHVSRYDREARSRKPDYDIGSTLNLLFRLPETDTLAYPVFEFDNNNVQNKPKLLVVGDSFFWNIYNTWIPFTLFSDAHFWYFNSFVFPETYKDTLSSKSLDLREQLETNDVILVMITERFLYKLVWGFADDAFELYAPLSHYDTMRYTLHRILTYDTWFDQILGKAETSGSTLAQTLEREVRYIYQQKYPEEFFAVYGPYAYIQSILTSREWLESIRQKAVERNISVDSMISIDANYMFENERPEQYVEHKRIAEFKNKLLEDTSKLNQIKKIAGEYYMTLDEAMMVEIEKEFSDIFRKQ